MGGALATVGLLPRSGKDTGLRSDKGGERLSGFRMMRNNGSPYGMNSVHPSSTLTPKIPSFVSRDEKLFVNLELEIVRSDLKVTSVTKSINLVMFLATTVVQTFLNTAEMSLSFKY